MMMARTYRREKGVKIPSDLFSRLGPPKANPPVAQAAPAKPPLYLKQIIVLFKPL